MAHIKTTSKTPQRKTAVRIRMAPARLAQVKKRAKKEGLSISAFIAQSVINRLDAERDLEAK